MQENKSAKIAISFKSGIYKYSGLMDLVQELKIFERDGFSYILPNGKKMKMKYVRENETEIFSDEKNLKAVGEAIKKSWSFGSSGIDVDCDYDFLKIDKSDEDEEEFILEDEENEKK